MIIVSACLCGINCKYNGENNLNDNVVKLVKEGNAVLICPEQLGGLPTPRKPCEIVNGTGKDVLDGTSKVISCDGIDFTQAYIKGANEALKIAKLLNCKKAILKYKSPSCGLGNIYDGNFNKNLISGNGVTAELFLRNNIEVYTEKDINKNIKLCK